MKYAHLLSHSNSCDSHNSDFSFLPCQKSTLLFLICVSQKCIICFFLSFLQWGRPIFYLIWSCAWAIYHLTWICIDGYLFTFKVEPKDRGKWFVYLSNWSYLLLTLHAIFDFLIACRAHILDDHIIKGRFVFSCLLVLAVL